MGVICFKSPHVGRQLCRLGRASIATTCPTLRVICFDSSYGVRQLCRLAPSPAPISATWSTFGVICFKSPHVGRQLCRLGRASIATTCPTLRVNCVRSPHVRRQLCHLAPRQAPIAAVYMCVPIFGFRGLDLYTRFGFCSGLQNKKLDSTYTRGRLIHEDILY